MKIIHAHIYNPAGSHLFKQSANSRAQLFLVMCDNTENCSLYKQGECIRRNLTNSWCPYGKEGGAVGLTRKARKFYDKISEWREKYKEELTHTLKSAQHKIAKVGDYYYLPYSYMSFDIKNVPFLSNSTVFTAGRPFISVEEFTPEVIVSLLNHRPMAMMGGEITAYQKKEVPLFAMHLYENYREIFDKVNAIKEITGYIGTYSYIGRHAYLHSLRAGTVVYKNKDKQEPFVWDGEFLTTDNPSLLFCIVSYDSAFLKLKPKVGSTVIITSNDQVDANTKFAD